MEKLEETPGEYLLIAYTPMLDTLPKISPQKSECNYRSGLRSSQNYLVSCSTVKYNYRIIFDGFGCKLVTSTTSSHATPEAKRYKNGVLPSCISYDASPLLSSRTNLYCIFSESLLFHLSLHLHPEKLAAQPNRLLSGFLLSRHACLQ